MVISKKATKLMAFVLALAFVLTGLAYMPKQAQAADVYESKVREKDGIYGTQASVRLDSAVSVAGWGRYDAQRHVVVIDDESNVNSATDFELPDGIAVGETVKITVKGSYNGDTGFRMGIGAGESEIFQLSQNMFSFSADTQGEFTTTFTATNDCGRHNNQGVGGTEPATKLSVKGPQLGVNTVNGLTIESITVNYVDRTPDVVVDLSNSESYEPENGEPAINYSDEEKSLNVEFEGWQGIIIMNPAEDKMIGNYKYVTIEYTSDREINFYVLDGQDEEYTEKSKLPAADTFSKVTYEADNAIYGIKLFRFNSPANISIKSVVFSHKNPAEPEQPIDPSVPPVYNKLDLSDTSSYVIDGGEDTTAIYNNETGILDVSIRQFEGIIFKNSAENVDDYKYVTLVYANVESTINSYIFDGMMGNDGKGQNPSGQQSKDTLSGVGEQTVKYEAVNSMYGLKLVHVNWGHEDNISMSIKSVIFSDRELTDEEIVEIAGGSSPVVTEYDTPVGFMDNNVSAAGTVEDITYGSTVIKNGEIVERKAKVVLPKGYSTDKRYPVVYMLHGIGCNETTLYNDKTQNVFWNAAATGDAKDIIAVFPNVCANETGKPPVGEDGKEKFFSLEHYAAYDNFVNDLEQCLMPYINENYSTLTGRENTAICGFSMGGREALYIGLTRAAKFGYVGGFCPAYGLLAYSNWTGVGENGMFASRADIRPADGYADNTLILIVKGTNDYTVQEQPYLYHSVLEENNIPHLYYETLGGDPVNVGDGGHGGWVYKHGLYNFITRIFK